MNKNSNNFKTTKKALIVMSIIIFLLIINRYRAGYLKDYMKEADFSSLHIIERETYKNQFQEIEIHDQKQIQDIYRYITEQKIRRKVKWSSVLRVEGGVTYNIRLISGPNEPIYFINLIGNNYVVIYNSHNSKSTVFRYVDGNIDLNYFQNLLELKNE